MTATIFCVRWSLKLFCGESILYLSDISIRTTYKRRTNYKGTANAIVCFEACLYAGLPLCILATLDSLPNVASPSHHEFAFLKT